MTGFDYRMLRKLSNVQIVPPQEKGLPAELEIVVQGVGEDEDSLSNIPTHILAILPQNISSPTSSQTQAPRITLQPTHAPLLATSCSSLPSSQTFLSALSRKVSQPIEDCPSNLSVPVLPLALPSPEMFGLLHAWFYVRNWKGIVSGLIPVPVGGFGSCF